MGSGQFLLDLPGGHEPVRSAGFSPQGRLMAGVASGGLKSALLGRFMERVRVLIMRGMHGSGKDGPAKAFSRRRALPRRV